MICVPGQPIPIWKTEHMGSCLSCLDYEAEETPGWAVLRNYHVDDITGASWVFIYLLYMDASQFRLLELHNAKLPPDHSTALPAPSPLLWSISAVLLGNLCQGKPDCNPQTWGELKLSHHPKVNQKYLLNAAMLIPISYQALFYPRG